MPKTLTEVTRDAAGLPAPERLKLARILLELSETATEPADDLQAAWDEEIARRLRELRTGAVKGVPLAEVKRKIEARFQAGESNSIPRRMPSARPRSSTTRTSRQAWGRDSSARSSAV